MEWPVVLGITGLASLLAWSLGWLVARGRPVVRYVDTSGSAARVFADVWRGKTLNFQLTKRHAVVVPHVTVPHGINWLERVAALYQQVKAINSAELSGKEKKVAQVMRYAVYLETVRAVYQLTKPFARFGYRRALYSRAKKDMVWMLDVIEQIVDFWILVKKKIDLLANGQTLRLTDGAQSTWDGWKVDSTGKRSIQPRFAS
jgi:hypothetical protein